MQICGCQAASMRGVCALCFHLSCRMGELCHFAPALGTKGNSTMLELLQVTGRVCRGSVNFSCSAVQAARTRHLKSPSCHLVRPPSCSLHSPGGGGGALYIGTQIFEGCNKWWLCHSLFSNKSLTNHRAFKVSKKNKRSYKISSALQTPNIWLKRQNLAKKSLRPKECFVSWHRALCCKAPDGMDPTPVCGPQYRPRSWW